MIVPHETYLSLMQTIRGRLDIIEELMTAEGDDFLRAESAAFHGRKIIEAIAFGCLVAVENGLNMVPRDARGQWNAASILKSLERKGLSVLPSPSFIRAPDSSAEQELGVTAVVEGIPERRLSHRQLIETYQEMHSWLHAVNPYTYSSHSVFHTQRAPRLWKDLGSLRRFIERHFISIRGAGFFCVTHDRLDGQTKVLPLSKQTKLAPHFS
jgi:hypothetical protein